MQVVKNSVIYLGGSILNKSIPFLLIPIITKYLSPYEYGMLSIYMIFIVLFDAFIGMNIGANISKNYFKVTKDEMAVYIYNMLIILVISFIFYFIMTVIAVHFFEEISSVPSILFLAIPIISVMKMINLICTTILRNEGRAYMYGIFEVSNTAITMSLTIALLVYFKNGWFSQPIGLIGGNLMLSIISIIYIYKNGYIKFIIDKIKIKSMLNISLPFIPHILGGVIIAMSDRIFIEHMIGLEEVGIYTLGYMFGMIVMVFSDSFIRAWSPWFYKNLAVPTDIKKHKIVKYTYIYIVGVFVLAVLISFAAEIIMPYFVDEKFYKAKEFILWIALGYAVNGVYKILFPYLVHISKTSFLAVSTVLAALINLILNYVLIKNYGAVGAAYATIVAFFISGIMVFWYQNKHYNMPWLMKNVNE